jgi:hypothetical protein
MRARKLGGAVSDYLRRNALACVALFFALSGGVAWATHPGGANTISSTDIINQEVRTADLAALSVTGGKLATGSVGSGKVVDESLRGEDIVDGTIGGAEVGANSLDGTDINESSLGQVPDAADADQASFASEALSAYNANHAESLVNNSVYVRTASVVVPGGSQADSNGNGFSRAISVSCDLKNGINRDMAVGGGAFWSGNPNSNSDELENRIHSAAFLDTTGDVATAGEFPFGYSVRGEVDKDGDDTLTVQVTCLRTFP